MLKTQYFELAIREHNQIMWKWPYLGSPRAQHLSLSDKGQLKP